ncbi:ATP-binding cassette domain-containing protein [Simiduia sp. 21SJ11W-1]|uniref:ABC transporter ATP-binding protein n=1 Tax=Simiduia sp. 21SJ11W-1 TaxID=2909669 RepID=UPI00209F07AD|nr:ATP-binding cassette domain-containing protein [Simiduia sp. 21SJ11W-1]UTA46914.1 ATP-binding cassette domain-containing protein [Simiduia sp. 21SJ11W-1]
MLEVHNLSKHFGSVTALDGLSFRAEDGRITGILGPNGAGKTTALRVLYGLLCTESGYARVDGIDVAEDAIGARKRLGVFPDKFGLYERLSAFEQIAYFAGLHGFDRARAKAATNAVIAKLGLEDIAQRRSQGFSQGQRMKVVLAQALVHAPQNLVLDEPTRGLDVMSTRVLRQQLCDLRDAGHCILFSSHVMQEVAALCDQVIVVAKGKVVAAGTPADLCAQTGKAHLEDAFVTLIGSDEGIAA